MMVSYTARRSLVPPSVVGARTIADFDITDASRSREVDRPTKRALNGRTETLHLYTDTKWAVSFAPVAGDAQALLTQFLDSTAAGEEFDVWLYGDESAPIRCVRADNGYAWQKFIDSGGRDTDLFTTTITLREVA